MGKYQIKKHIFRDDGLFNTEVTDIGLNSFLRDMNELLMKPALDDQLHSSE
jgi:hypothetical protein